MPSFVSRVERPDRGGEWIGYLRERDAAAGAGPARLGLDRPAAGGAAARASGCCTSTATRTRCSRRCCSRPPASPRRRAVRLVARCRPTSAPRCWPTCSASGPTAATGPGRGLEVLRYRFEIVADYGAFRDLQRHRMLTVQWQALTPDLGAGVPEEVAAAGCGDGVRARAGRLARRVRAPRGRRA